MAQKQVVRAGELYSANALADAIGVYREAGGGAKGDAAINDWLDQNYSNVLGQTRNAIINRTRDAVATAGVYNRLPDNSMTVPANVPDLRQSQRREAARQGVSLTNYDQAYVYRVEIFMSIQGRRGASETFPYTLMLQSTELLSKFALQQAIQDRLEELSDILKWDADYDVTFGGISQMQGVYRALVAPGSF